MKRGRGFTESVICLLCNFLRLLDRDIIIVKDNCFAEEEMDSISIDSSFDLKFSLRFYVSSRLLTFTRNMVCTSKYPGHVSKHRENGGAEMFLAARMIASARKLTAVVAKTVLGVCSVYRSRACQAPRHAFTQQKPKTAV